MELFPFFRSPQPAAGDGVESRTTTSEGGGCRCRSSYTLGARCASHRAARPPSPPSAARSGRGPTVPPALLGAAAPGAATLAGVGASLFLARRGRGPISSTLA